MVLVLYEHGLKSVSVELCGILAGGRKVIELMSGDAKDSFVDADVFLWHKRKMCMYLNEVSFAPCGSPSFSMLCSKLQPSLNDKA